ncbi:MAG TPA: F0F1 ATP synthase subunit A [Spirochaetia bacterium]|nr:F0F1 ATP synthase subunit A [Spirochaetia bacterium]
MSIHIRRVAFLLLLLTLIPHRALSAEARSAGKGESFDMAGVLFGELTDNAERPYATLPVLSVGGVHLDIKVTKHFLLIGVVALLVLASMLYLSRKLRDPYRTPTRLQSLFETLLEFMRDTIYEPVLGPDGKRFHLLCFTFFLFILYGNLLGMVPPFASIVPAGGGEAVWLGGAFTGNLASTLALGLITFVVFNVAGMRSKGILGYWKDLIPHGTPGWMAPITLLLEVVGIFSKTTALIMRLFANMIGGHVAILLILLLILKFQSLALGPVAVLVDLAISGLELFVAILQAYIFSFLSALFIGLAINKHG